MRKEIAALLMLVLLLGISACKSDEDVEESRIFQVNYISNEETRVIPVEYVMETELSDVETQVEELLEVLSTMPDKLSYKTPLGQEIEVIDFYLNEGNLILDMNENYLKLPVHLEVLTRAALVRTLIQIDGVNYIGMTVKDTPLMDSLGSPLGMMNSETFVDNEGSQINSMEQARIKLYFTDETGMNLIAVNRTLVYNTNTSIEKLVIDQLIAGPTEMTKGVLPTLSEDTKVLGVTVNDGTCYVNLDETFLSQITNATAEVVIYSIVNSLAELSNVNRVQISVNGETDIMYRETLSLNTVFERNLDLVVNPE